MDLGDFFPTGLVLLWGGSANLVLGAALHAFPPQAFVLMFELTFDQRQGLINKVLIVNSNY